MRNNLDKPVEYIRQIPINIGIYEIEYCPVHLHRDIEIAYLLKGSIELGFCDGKISLNEGDLYIINSNDLHEITGLSKDHQILLMRINIDHYMQTYKYLNVMRFYSDSADINAQEHIKHSLLKLYKLAQSDAGDDILITKLTDNIMYTLVHECQVSHGDMNNKINMVMDHIYNNYHNDISSEILTDSLGISAYDLTETLNALGYPTFSELLETIRIQESEKKLLGTEDSLEKIRCECGFSSMEDYVMRFNEIIGTMPDKHREKMMPVTIINMDVIGKVLTDVDLQT